MRLWAFVVGVFLFEACAPREPEEVPAPTEVHATCEAYDEARSLAVVAPAEARAKLEAALTREPPGTGCRRRMSALLGVLGRVDAPAPEVEVPPSDAIETTPVMRDDAAPRYPALVVVLDTGHGGNEFGATSDGVRESHLTLDIAQRTARILKERHPEIVVRLTRDADARVSLEQRAEMANAIGAHAFVSIHLNDAEGEVRRGGVTTFVLDTTKDEQALRLAARENGTSLEEVSQLSLMLATLERKAQLEASQRLAARVHRETLRGAREHLPRIADRGIKPALFQVLVGARMPAILLEASFMNIPGEREALRTARYRESLARGIAQGILSYFYEEA